MGAGEKSGRFLVEISGRNLVDQDMFAVRNQVSPSHPGEPGAFWLTKVSPVLVPEQATACGLRVPEQLFSMVPSVSRGGSLSPAPLRVGESQA